MADTVRTLVALQSLLADNTDGDISAQDIRDFLVSTGPEAARISKSTSQTLDASLTEVTFDREEFDTHGDLVDLTQNGFVIQTEGVYLVSAVWLWETGELGDSAYMQFMLNDGNDTSIMRIPTEGSVTGNNGGLSGTQIAYYEVDDVVTLSINPTVTLVEARGNASTHLSTSFAIARLGLPL